MNRKAADMGRLINIGFGNVVNSDKIVAITSPDSAPVKRMVQKARDEGITIDCTQGRKTKAVIVMENNQLVLSALLSDTIVNRFYAKDGNEEHGS